MKSLPVLFNTLKLNNTISGRFLFSIVTFVRPYRDKIIEQLYIF